MNKKLVVALISMSMLACLNGCSGTSSSVSNRTAFEKTKEAFEKEYDDDEVILSEAVTKSGKVLYITVDTDDEYVSELAGKLTNNDWFDYDSILISFYVSDKLDLTVYADVASKKSTFTVWIDENGNIVETPEADESISTTETKETETKISETEAPETKAPETKAPETAAPETQKISMEESNALRSAYSYLGTMAFSYTGLIDQLEYEGYSTESATYAADNCGADWKEQAAKSAASYIETMSFSRSGLIDQLEYEGFTSEQAEYGADAVGY